MNNERLLRTVACHRGDLSYLEEIGTVALQLGAQVITVYGSRIWLAFENSAQYGAFLEKAHDENGHPLKVRPR